MDKLAAAERWIAGAREELAHDPSSILINFMHVSTSSHIDRFEAVSEVYLKATTLEEHFLQQAVLCLVRRALTNALQDAIKEAERGGPYEAWRFLKLAEAYRLAGMVFVKDPMAACLAKVLLNSIAEAMHTNLHDLVVDQFGGLLICPRRVDF